ncbi:MAG TPA: DUF1653 domain-containing protein [Eubacterium sp.]|nr:DUF1653 domain-containing protein [Eubacterium sp.]
MYKLELRKEAAQEWRFIMARQLVIGGFYRHFKDKLYQVKGTAIHSETKEKMVIYQGLYGSYEMYVRPYDMFLSEVDHIKYPDVVQKYRFELIDIKTGKSLEADYEENNQNMESEKSEESEESEKLEESKESEESEESEEDSKLIRFLDAYDYKEKLDILTSMRGELNDGLIDIMAESIEVAVPEGDITDRYNSLRKCLMAHTKYEGLRLRQ